MSCTTILFLWSIRMLNKAYKSSRAFFGAAYLLLPYKNISSNKLIAYFDGQLMIQQLQYKMSDNKLPLWINDSLFMIHILIEAYDTHCFYFYVLSSLVPHHPNLGVQDTAKYTRFTLKKVKEEGFTLKKR